MEGIFLLCTAIIFMDAHYFERDIVIFINR